MAWVADRGLEHSAQAQKLQTPSSQFNCFKTLVQQVPWTASNHFEVLAWTNFYEERMGRLQLTNTYIH